LPQCSEGSFPRIAIEPSLRPKGRLAVANADAGLGSSKLDRGSPIVFESTGILLHMSSVARLIEVDELAVLVTHINACALVLQRVHDGARGRRDWPILVKLCSTSRYRMATLDEIGKEKQRISEALARVDAQREKLAGQLSELEATERVLARYSKGTQAKRTVSRKASTTEAAAPAQSGRRRRTTAAKPIGSNRGEPSLGDQILALANGKTQQEIAAACKGVRPNHIGIAIARHKRAGRIEERDGRLYATHSTATEQRATV
jgi:hypothetical protein